MAEKIKLVLEGDAKSLKSALDNSSSGLEKLATKSRDSINSFTKWGAAATVAGAAVIAGIVNSSRQSIDVLAKKSDQLGITTEKLAAFQHLGELTGVSSESMNSSLERMSKRLGEASQGMGAAAPQLERLNLSASELVKLSPDKQYEKVAEAVQGLSTQSEKAAATAAIFGREGLALLNTMEAGAEGFRAAEEDVLAFGTAISRVDAAKVEAANDSFERVQEALKGAATQLTVQLAPAMKVISDRFVDAARDSGGFTDQIVAGLDIVIEAVAFLGDMVKGLSVVWQLAEVAALGFISATLTGLDELQTAAAGALNWIPGVDVVPSAALSEWAQESRLAVMAASEELGKMVDEPMPSTEIKKFFDDVKVEAQAAAEEIAETKKVLTAPVESESEGDTAVDTSIQKELDAQAVKYEKLRIMAEEFELTEAEREVARFERENDQFNLDLEKMIENGLTVDEALAEQNQVRLDAEAIHQQKLSGIQTDAKSTTGATILKMEEAVISQTWALADTLAAGSADAQAALLAIRAGIAISETIINTQVASARAFADLGPILGAPAAASIQAMGAVSVGLIAANAVAKVAQAHDGLDRNPSEGTFLLKRDEMVLDSGTSQAVRDAAPALAGGGGTAGGISIENINITSDLTEQNSKSYVRDVLIPELNDAIRDGFLLGRGATA